MVDRSIGRWVVGLGLSGLLGMGSGCARETARAPLAVAPETRREIAQGTVVGARGGVDSDVWLGLPYAAPPVGDLRWRAPRPPAAWEGVREAVRFGSPCPQYASEFGGVPGPEGSIVGEEDCLYLNVWAPRAEAGKAAPRRPVMLWIHGGGNSIGEAGFYDGSQLATEGQVVVVTTNYRLGPLGWFRHAALRDGSGSAEDASGNFGTLDLIAALDWVRQNAAAFGGDPDNVTIFGESAGGANVYSLLLAPQARGLFHRAIVQSGGMFFSSVERAESEAGEAEDETNGSGEAVLRLLQRQGSSDREAARAQARALPAAELARRLRQLPARDVVGLYEPSASGMIFMPLVFRDGTVLPVGDPVAQLGKPGGVPSVPVMLGTNRDENRLFLFADPEHVRWWFWLVPRMREPHLFGVHGDVQSQLWKVRGVDDPARALRSVPGSSVFAYRFDWDEEPSMLGADLSQLLGAAHGFEIPFVFGHFELGRRGNVIFSKENEPGRRQLSAAMISYWSEFARTGNPAQGRDGSLPVWSEWNESSPGAPKFLVLDTVAGGGIRMSSESLTREGVLAAVATDPRLKDTRDRCAVFRELAKMPRSFTRADYAALPECRGFPYESYPWR